jgi:molybdopterin-synthase adenylyltransferase
LSERYFGHLDIPGWDDAAQRRLGGAGAIVVGAGGLGAAACAYLAAAGVGRIGVVDGAAVELSGLHRQAMHFTAEIGANKAESVALKLGLLNTDVRAEPYPVRLEEMNAAAIVAGADVALDCSSSSITRRLVNEACCAERVPLVTAGASGLSGFLMSIRPGESACHACASPEAQGAEGAACGSLGALAGALGSLQALEAVKLLAGLGNPLLDRILRLDGEDMAAKVDPVERDPGCPACAEAFAARQSR